MNNRRSFLHSVLATGIAPYFVPASVLRSETAPSNKTTLGVIGCGAQGTHDMRAFLTNPNVRVTALCDVNQRRIDTAKGHIKESYGSDEVKVFSDFRELNRDASIDAVLMALPVHWHSIPSTDAVLNKKHIYHEKPMGMSVAEAKHVRAAVRQTGVVFQFGTQQRSDLKFRWACELARNGRLGKVKEIQVAVLGGITSQEFPKQPVPEFIDWERWVGPAAFTDYNIEKTKRHFHENISNFSLGMLSCWGIHHLDIAQWGNGTDDTGPVSVGYEAAEWPASGTCDNVLGWRMRFEYAKAAPITFVNETRDDIAHGIRFIGENGWVHVRRGDIKASDEAVLRDPANKAGAMPLKLPVSLEHTANFIEAVRASGSKTVCDVETAVRSDTLCQLAAIAVKTKRALKWDPSAETIQDDAEAAKLLEARPFRGDWKLPSLG
ncbi:MAG: hypothetical protein RLZZ476_423 [Verrucomicrobiota bacterium]|jgi:predicted dehydrogenase